MSNVAKALKETDQIKVRQYIDVINNYEACLGAATLALRMLWELVFTYQNVKPDGEPIQTKHSDDKKFVNQKNTIPAEYETYKLISSCCHYQEEHDSITQEGRNIRFRYLVSKSREPICTRFRSYVSDSSCEEAQLLNSIIVMFERFSQSSPIEWPSYEVVSEPSVEYGEQYIDRICSEYYANIESLMANIYYLRYIPEMILHKKAKDVNPDISKTNLSDFIDIFRGGKYKDSQLYDLANRAEIFSRMLNPRVHWFYTENTQYDEGAERREISNVRPLLSELLTQTLAEKAEMPAVGKLIQAFQGNSQECYANIANRFLDDLRNLEQECDEAKSTAQQLKEKKKKEDRASTLMLIFLILFVICGLIWLWFTIFLHPGDPNPQIRESIDSTNNWFETPSVAVLVDGKDIEENQTIVLYENEEPVSIQIDAVCNGEYSLRSSQEARLANRFGYSENSFGLSKLQYQLHSMNYDSAENMSMGRYSLPVDSGSAQFTEDLLPGWYCLGVQAVGAGDGIVKDGNELIASTGWINYYLLVLPADESVSWTVLNRNTNSYAATKDGLSIQEGQELVVNCDATIQDGLELYYAWDSDSWASFDVNTDIEVPQMETGLHTLNLRACYAFDGNIVAEVSTNSFSCMFEAPSLPECNVELTVIGPDGAVVQDGSTIIVEPGDEISVSAYGRYGISRLEWSGKYQDGTVKEGNSHESDSITITLGGQYGEGTRSMYITAIGVGDGGIEDHLNRKHMSINLLYRTHEDEYDGNGILIKDWLYEDDTSNEPTGYSTYSISEDAGITTETWAWYLTDGSPAYRKDEGYHSWTKIKNTNGYEAWVFDLDGITPIENTNAFGEHAGGAAGIIVRDNGNTYSCYYYGADRKLRSGSKGNAGYEQVTDEYGNILEDRAYGTDGKPVVNTDGWHFYKSTYEDGYETESCFFDADDNPCEWKGGWHRAVYTYDDYGNKISAIYYHADGSAVITDGYSKWEKVFLPGTETEESCEYLDENDTPVMNTSLGYSRVDRKYVDGILMEEAFYDAGGSPTNCLAGYAYIEYINTPSYKATLYKDVDGNLVIPNGQHWAKCEKFYDIDGNLTDVFYYADETTYIGYEGEKSPAHFKYYYDEKRLTGEYYFDHNDDPMAINNTNYCGMSYIYDSSDASAYYVYYLDECENPIINESGFYMAKKTVDKHGNVIREERFMQDGTMPTGDLIRRIEWTFDKNSKRTSEIVYTEPRVGVISQTVETYDSKGNLSSIAYYDGNGSPIEDVHGVQKYTYTWTDDEEAKITTLRVECLDDRGELTIGPDQYAAVEVKYSWEEEPDYVVTRESFRIGEWWFGSEAYLEVRYIGPNGKDMMIREKGYAAYRKNTSASCSVEEFLDQTGKLVYVDDLGYAKLVRDYEDGDMIQWAFYGDDDQLCLNHYGFAMEKWIKDGDRTIHSFHDVDESLMMNEYGTYALAESEYNSNGDLVYKAYKDADEDLMINPDYGYAVYKREEHDGVILDMYYDENEDIIQSD